MFAVGLPQFEQFQLAPSQVRLLCPSNPQVLQAMLGS
ncbi:Uncharacterised protein [Mycobacteroides abscessus]|nr:Uncharacterised protein [Mycobacteroides abscessus]